MESAPPKTAALTELMLAYISQLPRPLKTVMTRRLECDRNGVFFISNMLDNSAHCRCSDLVKNETGGFSSELLCVEARRVILRVDRC